jgi:hypothetical protein
MAVLHATGLSQALENFDEAIIIAFGVPVAAVLRKKSF